MVTTKISDKERKLRSKLRIKEVKERDGTVIFYPQIKKFGIWWEFDDPDLFFLDILFKDPSVAFKSLSAARFFIDNYVNTRLRKREVLYHNVDYLVT